MRSPLHLPDWSHEDPSRRVRNLKESYIKIVKKILHVCECCDAHSGFTYITILWGRPHCLHLPGEKIRPRHFKGLVQDLARVPEPLRESVLSKYLWNEWTQLMWELIFALKFPNPSSVTCCPDPPSLSWIPAGASHSFIQQFSESSLKPQYVPGPV